MAVVPENEAEKAQREWEEHLAVAPDDSVTRALAVADAGYARAAHRAADAEARGVGICRTCLAPIWNEGGTVGHVERAEGWSDRIKRGGDSLVCFSAVEYRHVPLTGREAGVYDAAYKRGLTAISP